MPLQFLIDILTGNLVLVDVPTPVTPIEIEAGMPMGLLLTLTYS